MLRSNIVTYSSTENIRNLQDWSSELFLFITYNEPQKVSGLATRVPSTCPTNVIRPVENDYDPLTTGCVHLHSSLPLDM